MLTPPFLLQDFLQHTAVHLSEKVALVCGDQYLTCEALHRQSNRLAHSLIQARVQPGDRVLLYVHNGVEAVISFWAVLKANAVVAVLNPTTQPEKLAYYLNAARAAALITENRLIAAAWAAADQSSQRVTVWVADNRACPARATPPERRNRDIDLAAIIYTSGSTGDPKRVMLTHRNMIAASTSINAYLRNVADDVILNALPLSFATVSTK